MEKRIIPCAERILLNHPHAKKVTFFCGKDNNGTPDSIFYALGIDGLLELNNGVKLTFQIQCGTRENYEAWGRHRQSFLLGNSNNIYCTRYLDKCIHQPQIMLSCYEFTPGTLMPFILLPYQLLIRRVLTGGLEVSREKNMQTGEEFCWAQQRHLLMSKLVINNIMVANFTL